MCIRQHTSAYVSTRQHRSGWLCVNGGLLLECFGKVLRPHTSAYADIRQHASAYVNGVLLLELREGAAGLIAGLLRIERF